MFCLIKWLILKKNTCLLMIEEIRNGFPHFKGFPSIKRFNKDLIDAKINLL